MLFQPLTYKNFILYILIIIIIIFSINLYKKCKIEPFESKSILSKLKNNTNDTNNKSKIKKKVTFDDLLKKSEDFDVEKYSISNIKNNFFTYVNSFSKDKFTNITGSPTETLEKFSYFKDKFFEIFT